MQAILVALLSSPVILWFLARFDKRNTAQHASNMAMLEKIHDNVEQVGNDVKEVRKDLFDHIAFHAHKESEQDGVERRTDSRAQRKVSRRRTTQ